MTIKRCYPVIIGASVGENQLCNGESVTVPNGHKYYLKKSGTESLGASSGTAITGLTSGSDMVIDLTQMLGASIADRAYTLEQTTPGSGLAWLRSYGFLSGGYQAYNSGSIESVEVTEKVCTGFNAWDEEWENGYYNRTTGAKAGNTDTSYFRCKNMIPCLPNTTYFIKMPSVHASNTSFFPVLEYDASGNYIKSTFHTEAVPTLTTSAQTQFMTFYCEVGTRGATYQNDICINLSSDRNGEYEPYTSTTYSLGSDTLRGIFKLDNGKLYADGDRKEADGTITRKYGVVDLGTLTWEYVPNITCFRCGSIGGANVSTSDVGNGICAKYGIYTYNSVQNGTEGLAFRTNSGGLLVRNSAYTDAASFKTAMSGVYLVYELATPTTETSTPFTSPQIVYPDGTERFVTENNVPVGHESKYQL